ncbi:MAG: hypothetical protein HFI72_05590 [Peptococcaceae bacterium]|jgi:hypothetical protein|nr:hypothetical protein [Peptococcaceae bacterium]
MDYPFFTNGYTAVNGCSTNTSNVANNNNTLTTCSSCNNNRTVVTNTRTANGQIVLPTGCFCPPSRCNRVLASPCCQGMTPDTRGCTSSQVYTYANIVFDAKEVEGDQIKEKICVPSDECNFTAIYNGCNGCCDGCPQIDEHSCFKVVSYCIRVKHARPRCLLTGADFTINNYPANDADVEHLGFDTYRIPLSGFTPDIYEATCTCDNLGTKASLIVSPNGFPVEYMMEYALCGYVTTSCGTYCFEITFEDACPMVTNGLTSFFVKDLCLPIPRCHQIPELKTSFCFDASLVAPEIHATCCNHLVLTDTLVITPKVLAETTVNKRVVATVCQFPDNEIYCCK